MHGLENKVAWILGATSGIGEATAKGGIAFTFLFKALGSEISNNKFKRPKTIILTPFS